jgi:hypothetical protein
MGTCFPPTARRSPRRLAGLAAAVTGLAARPAAAAPPMDAPLEEVPRTPPVHSSYQTWVGLTVQGAIVDPLRMFVDFSGGFHSDMHPAAIVVRPALGVSLPHGFSIFVGCSFASFWDEAHNRGEEQVVFQQVAYSASLPVVQLFARLRGEQRFRPDSDVAYRLRALVQLNVPFWSRAPLQLVLWDEIFVALNQPEDWQPTVLDLDLFFAGLGWDTDPNLRIEAGYMGMVAPRSSATDLIHTLSIGATVSW